MRRFLKAGNHKSTHTQSNRAWSLSGASWNYGRDDDPLPGGWKPQNKGRDMEGREDESLPTGWIPKCRLICEPTHTMFTLIHKDSFPPNSSTTFHMSRLLPNPLNTAYLTLADICSYSSRSPRARAFCTANPSMML